MDWVASAGLFGSVFVEIPGGVSRLLLDVFDVLLVALISAGPG